PCLFSAAISHETFHPPPTLSRSKFTQNNFAIIAPLTISRILTNGGRTLRSSSGNRAAALSVTLKLTQFRLWRRRAAESLEQIVENEESDMGGPNLPALTIERASSSSSKRSRSPS